MGEKKYAEAEPLLLSGFQEISESKAKTRPDARVRLTKVLVSLVRLYEATGQTNQSAQWKQKLEEFDRTKTKE